MQLGGEEDTTPAVDGADSPVAKPPDSVTHSFVIRIWIEETVEEAGRVIWRGSITHFPGNERRFIQELKSIEDFIAPFLEAMGVRLGLLRELRHLPGRVKRIVQQYREA